MFYTYQNKVYYEMNKYALQGSGHNVNNVNTHVLILMNVTDHTEPYDIEVIAVLETACQTLLVNYEQVNGYNFGQMLCFMIEQPYKRSRNNDYDQIPDDQLVWVFTYNDKPRKLYRFVKIFQDGFLGDMGDDEVKHFKWDRVQHNYGLHVESKPLRCIVE